MTPRHRRPILLVAVFVLLTSSVWADESWPRLERVIVVSKTHFDIGFTDMASKVVDRYRTSMIDNALKVMKDSNRLPPEQRFKWTLAAWPLARISEDWPGQAAERKAKLDEALKTQRLLPHALPFTTHTEMNELESLVQGLGYAVRLNQAIGQPPPRAAKMTDVPSHSWVIPTLLKHAGVDFLHLGCNSASSSPKVPTLFWWEGPDGSRLLTMYIAEGYGTSAVPPPGWPYKTWLAMLMTGDNHGPPREDEVRAVIEDARNRLPKGVKVEFGSLDDFARAILEENPDLPVVRGDMPDTWIYGPMANPRGVALARKTGPLIGAEQSLHTLLGAWGLKRPSAATKIADAYEQALLYGEHTWGGSMGWFGRKLDYGKAWKDARAKGKYRRNEASWEEHTDYIRNANKIITPLVTADLDALASAVKVDGRRIVVFNPLPWKRDGLVTLPESLMGVDAVRAVDTEDVLPVDPVSRRFLARGVPSLGYQTYVPATSAGANDPKKKAADGNVLENARLKVVLDAQRGVIRSLVNKSTGEELADTGAPYGLGQILYERFSRDDVERWENDYIKLRVSWSLTGISKPGLPPATETPHSITSPETFTVSMRRTAVDETAVMHAEASEFFPHAVTTTVTLYHDQPYLDLAVTLHDKPADSWPEAGWIAMPLAVADPHYKLGRLGGVVNPATDIVRGSNNDTLWLNTGLTVTDDHDRGVGLCPVDSPLVSIGRPGLWRHSKAFAPEHPWFFVNLYNNQWSTNFRLWNSGTWTSRVRIWAVDRGDNEHDLITPSWDARSPLLVASADGPAGKLPTRETGLTLSRKGVLVTAFGSEKPGGPLVLRLWEQAGQSGPCDVRFPSGLKPTTARPVDLRGKQLGPPVKITNDLLTVDLKAYAPVTYEIATGSQ